MGSSMRNTLWLALALAACTGGDSDTGAGDTGPVPTYEPTWDGVTAFLADECSQCHAADNAVILPRDLESDVRLGLGDLAVPGDPDASLLWRVVSHELQAGDQGMPLGQPALPDAEVAHVREWILAGCPLPPICVEHETCNGADDDCDGTIDEDATDAVSWHEDLDDDGFGGALASGCKAPTDAPLTGTDCDDADPDVPDGLTWYADADEDGFGDPNDTAFACAAPAGFVADDTDCDGASGTVHPGALEACDSVDHDCDGLSNEDESTDAKTWFADTDDDGFGVDVGAERACAEPEGTSLFSGDCGASDPAIHPGANEFCDGVDEDCDGTADDAPVNGTNFFVDGDADGFGTTVVVACALPAGAAVRGDDCDDADDAAFPGAPETCSDTDDRNCDGALGTSDGDGDGIPACQECDDGDKDVFPGAQEVCNGRDDDCDGSTDEAGATGFLTFFKDGDGDNHGLITNSVQACTAPSGFVASSGDCDDGDKKVFPGAPETCNTRDDDCDAVPDDDATDARTFFRDADADLHGAAAVTTKACAAPSGFVTSSDDCDDADGTAFPGAPETCDGVDDNCNTAVDESAVDAQKWFRDADGDAHGTLSSSKTQCAQPSGFVLGSDDCNDGASTVFPGATELCDRADGDCDGTVPPDEVDNDGDSFVECSTVDADCNDAASNVFPRAFEACNGADDDCDGAVPLDEVDNDGDSFHECSFVNPDCNDANAQVHPGRTADPTDALDNDCDGLVDEDARVWSHAADIQPIWNSQCTGCHSSPGPSGSMDLAGNAFDDIVNVASSGLPSMKRINPGSPSTSYVFHKVAGTQFDVGGNGGQMGSLSPAQLETMRLWIVQGCNP